MMNYIKYIFIIPITLSLISCLSVADKDLKKNEELKNKIKKYNLDKYAEDEYKNAELSDKEFNDLLAKKNTYKASKVIINVNDKYQKVLDKGFPILTNEKDNQAIKIINDSEKIKANVALKDQFDEAKKQYDDAISLKDEKKYENAVDKLIEVNEKFEDIYNKTSEKKVKTEKSIDSSETIKDEVQNNLNKIEEKKLAPDNEIEQLLNKGGKDEKNN